MMADSQIIGIPAFRQALAELPTAIKEQALNKADAKVAAGLARKLRKLVPSDNANTTLNERFGTLRRNIKRRGIRRNSRARRQYGNTQIVSTGDAFWALFVERGTDERFTRTGASRGKITAKPFFEPAVKAYETEAVNIYITSARDEIAKAVKRFGAKYSTLNKRERRLLAR